MEKRIHTKLSRGTNSDTFWVQLEFIYLMYLANILNAASNLMWEEYPTRLMKAWTYTWICLEGYLKIADWNSEDKP